MLGALLLFALGAGVLVLAESTLLRTGSALVLVAAVFAGVAAVATPELLAGDEEADPRTDT